MEKEQGHEYIKREDVLRIMRRAFDFDYNEETAVENLPTADVVEVVRCKDCKKYMTIHCTCDGCCINDEWYCADGERKEQEHEQENQEKETRPVG